MTDGVYANGERIGKVISVSAPSTIDDWVQKMYINSSYFTRDAVGDRFEYYDPELAEEAMQGETLDDMIQEARDICIDYP